MKPRSERDSRAAAGPAKATSKSFTAQLLDGLFDWRRREAQRTIDRYDFLIAQAVYDPPASATEVPDRAAGLSLGELVGPRPILIAENFPCP